MAVLRCGTVFICICVCMHIHKYHKTHICTLIYERCAYIYTRYSNVILSVLEMQYENMNVSARVHLQFKYTHTHTHTHTHRAWGSSQPSLQQLRCQVCRSRCYGRKMNVTSFLKKEAVQMMCLRVLRVLRVLPVKSVPSGWLSRLCHCVGVYIFICSCFRAYIACLLKYHRINALCVCMHVIHLHACVCDVCVLCVCENAETTHT